MTDPTSTLRLRRLIQRHTRQYTPDEMTFLADLARTYREDGLPHGATRHEQDAQAAARRARNLLTEARPAPTAPSGPPPPADPDTWLARRAALPDALWTDTDRATLTQLAQTRPDARTLELNLNAAQYARQGQTHLPPNNPYQPGDLLDALRRHRQGTWPHRGAHLGPRPVRCAAIARGTPCTGERFYDWVDADMYTRAVLHVTLQDPTHGETIVDLKWQRAIDGTLSYDHPDKQALARTLGAIRTALWRITVHEGYANRRH